MISAKESNEETNKAKLRFIKCAKVRTIRSVLLAFCFDVFILSYIAGLQNKLCKSISMVTIVFQRRIAEENKSIHPSIVGGARNSRCWEST